MNMKVFVSTDGAFADVDVFAADGGFVFLGAVNVGEQLRTLFRLLGVKPGDVRFTEGSLPVEVMFGGVL